jgi:diaminopimelate epimerase
MRFSKYHGTKNDFILIGDPACRATVTADLVVAACDRRSGAGADGLIRIATGAAAAAAGIAGPDAAQADFFMDHYNADGRTAEMCGNGIRCLAKFAFDRGLTASRELDVMTRAGMKHLSLHVGPGGMVDAVTVDMGRPELDVSRVPMRGDAGTTFVGRPFEAAGRTWTATAVSMGNPHIVLFLDAVDDVASVGVDAIGPQIERRPEFPNGTNVEFVKVVDGSIHMRVWERGVGQTAACGTGACASLVACALNGLTGRVAEVSLPGGRLHIDWQDDGGVLMTGPAEWVFDGEFSAAWLAAAVAGGGAEPAARQATPVGAPAR